MYNDSTIILIKTAVRIDYAFAIATGIWGIFFWTSICVCVLDLFGIAVFGLPAGALIFAATNYSAYNGRKRAIVDMAKVPIAKSSAGAHMASSAKAQHKVIETILVGPATYLLSAKATIAASRMKAERTQQGGPVEAAARRH